MIAAGAPLGDWANGRSMRVAWSARSRLRFEHSDNKSKLRLGQHLLRSDAAPLAAGLATWPSKHAGVVTTFRLH
jgi:hypothetical protein